jgi:hypothetical protein
MVNYPVYMASLGDFEVGISTSIGKGKGRNDARLSEMAPRSLPIWYGMTEGNIEVDVRIGTLRWNIKGPKKKKKRMMEGM